MGKLQRHASSGKLIRTSSGKLATKNDKGECCCCFTSTDGCFQSEFQARVTAYNNNIGLYNMRVRKHAETPKFFCAFDTVWDDDIVADGGGHSGTGLLFEKSAPTCEYLSASQNLGWCQCVERLFSMTPSPWSTIIRNAKEDLIEIDQGTPADAPITPLLGTCTSLIQLRIPASTGAAASTMEFTGQFDFLFGGPSATDSTSTPDDPDSNYILLYRSQDWGTCTTGSTTGPDYMRLWLELI